MLTGQSALDEPSQYRVAFHVGEIDEFERRFMRGFQDHVGRASGLERFLPAGGAKAPAVARFQSRKLILGMRRREIVAARFRVFEKRLGHPDADHMHAVIAFARPAATVAEPAGERIDGTGEQGSAEDIERFARHDTI